MTGVELLDGDLEDVAFATYGKPLIVRVHVNAKKDLHDVELGLGFSTDGGVTIAGPNSKAAGTLYSLREGDSFIDYKIDQVVFQPGRLWLTTCFVRDGQIFDLSDRRTELIVRADRTMDEPGLVTLAPGHWSKRPGLPVPGEGQQ
ncbi:Wzt carbohydrate-binding domain-containing protein [Actinomyces ruminis]|uniref:Wzt carbohydrate-binding domain-containing protein n=1 Tax=Actinomyces ruminis TaxID=1937003 RepID=UPI00211E17C9|nr:Wzt carbohydrate-binding domain-containing protein [Actinomyces ruminis]